MRAAFCSIVTDDWLPQALALYRGLRQHHIEPFHLLLASMQPNQPLPVSESDLHAHGYNLHLHRLGDIVDATTAAALRRRCLAWSGADGSTLHDLLRWSCKPLMIQTLLHQYERVLYFDADIHIVADVAFLLDALDNHGVLLTPHWRCLQPHGLCELYKGNFYGGLFNAGFLGFSRSGQPALAYWQEMCSRYVGRSELFYDDQRYLDVLPVYFPNVHIVRHLGCNVASWNRHRNIRSLKKEKVVINDHYPLTFIHFSNFNYSADPLLQTHFHDYQDAIDECRRLLNDLSFSARS